MKVRATTKSGGKCAICGKQIPKMTPFRKFAIDAFREDRTGEYLGIRCRRTYSTCFECGNGLTDDDLLPKLGLYQDAGNFWFHSKAKQGGR